MPEDYSVSPRMECGMAQEVGAGKRGTISRRFEGLDQCGIKPAE
jgi:hypothetical protein